MMTWTKRAAALLAAAAALLLQPGFVLAGTTTGTSAFQFLQLGVGARPSAMGETYAAAAGDVNAIYWNPAGLAALDRRELSVSHAFWLGDISYSNFACGVPVRGGAVAAAFNVLNTGDIQEADSAGARLGDSYNMSDVLGILSYARGWGNLSLGANFKYVTSRIEAETAHSYAADLGAVYSGLKPWDRKLSAGLSVQNLGTRAGYVSEKSSLPVIVRAGISLELFKGLLALADVNYTEKTVNIHSGAEYSRAFGALVLAARAGYKNDTVTELGALSGLTAGLGVKWKDYQLDYAWNSFTDLGITHRVSMGIKFGVPTAKAKAP